VKVICVLCEGLKTQKKGHLAKDLLLGGKLILIKIAVKKEKRGSFPRKRESCSNHVDKKKW